MEKKGVSGMVRDPVCGMNVYPKTAINKAEYQGQTYTFCSTGCKLAFEKEAEKYVNKVAHEHHH